MGAMALRGVALATVLVPWMSGADARAADLLVPGQFTTIQSAIDAAVAGDRVLVAPGVYPERLRTFGKAIVLESTSDAEQTVVDGASAGSVLRCVDGETSATMFVGLTFRNGAAPIGAGVYANSASPTFRGCIFEANIASDRGGGVAGVNARMTFENCVFRDCRATERGGAVYLLINSDTAFVNCSFTGNEARNRNETSYGGAVAAESASDVSFATCSFATNKAAPESGFSGGAIGGALWLSGVVATFDACDFQDNSAIAISGDAGGGAIWSTGPTSIANGAFTGNRAETSAGGSSVQGGAVYLASAGPVAPSTFTGNVAMGGTTARGGALCVNSGKSIDLGGCIFASNRVENASNGSGGAAALSVSATVASTLTCTGNAILSCSSGAFGGAIEAGGSMEIGTLVLEDNAIGPKGFTTSNGSGGGLSVGADLTISGGTASRNTLRTANGGGGAISCGNAVVSGVTFESNAMTGAGGSATLWGGALRTADASISDCTFTGNSITGGPNARGGALASQGALTITATQFNACRLAGQSNAWGGAVYADTVDMSDCQFTDCEVTDGSTANGGGISIAGATMIADAVFTRCASRNASNCSGGAIHVENGITTLRFVQCLQCSAQASGSNASQGGALRSSGNILIEDSTFEECRAEANSGTQYGYGGAVYCRSNTTPVVRRTTFTSNHAGQGRAAGYIELANGGPFTFEDCTVTGNTTASGEGAISVSNPTSMHVARSTFTSNTGAANGGALSCGSNGFSAVIEDCAFTGNTANSTGGAIHFPQSNNVTLLRSTFTQNAARSSSGAVDLGRFAEITDCAFTGNTVEFPGAKGGAVRCRSAGDSGPITNSTFDSNTCAEGVLTSGDAGGGAVWSEGSIGAITLSEFRGNRASGLTARGGAIRAASIASIADCVFSDCGVFGQTLDGGAIFVAPSTTYSIGSLSNSTFSSCRASNASRNYAVFGGAIRAQGGRFGVMTGCTFTDCEAEGITAYGGAIRAERLEGISGCRFERCSATSRSNGSARGGALYASNNNASIVPVDTTDFVDCRATVETPVSGSFANGGAIEWISAEVAFATCAFTGNSVSAESATGGAGYLRATSFLDCEFAQNRAFSPTASALGGAVRLEPNGGPTTFTNCHFVANVADGNTARGGALIRDDARVLLEGCTLAGNAAREGGALHFSNGNAPDVAHLVACTFVKNSAARGAALRFENTTGIRIDGCEFAQNLAFDDGGALSLRMVGPLQPDTGIVQSVFAGNISTSGGAVRLDSGGGAWDLPVTGCVFSGNLAVEGGAILTTGGTGAQPALAGDLFCANSPDDIVGDWRDDGGNGFGSGSDCNGNGICDDVDLATGLAEDCNANGVPDGCDIAAGAEDSNSDGVPDECQCIGDIVPNGFVDGGDLSALLGTWGNASGDLSADLDGDGQIGGSDLALLLSNWGPCGRP